jgi:WXG100 protein secretion system (Wss), protein YukD
MSMIRIRVLDVSGSKVRDVDAPDDIAVNRIIALLVEKMALPLNSPDGQIMSYKLHHRRSGQQLLDTRTLSEGGVVGGDELRLQPEITAG